MVRKIQKILKCMIIYIVLFMIILSSVAYGYSSSDVAGAVAGYSLNLLTWGNDEENFCDGPGGYGPALRYNQLGNPNRTHHPTVSNPDPELPWFWDCSSFASNMYDIVTENAIHGGEEHACSGLLSDPMFESTGVVDNGSTPSSEVVPGDILLASGHVEIYLGPEYGTGGAHSNHTGDVNAHSNSKEQVDCAAENRGYITYSPAGGTYYRLTDSAASKVETLDTTFSIAGTRSGSNINYSKFFFNGVPDGKYSLAKRSFWQVIIDSIAQILDFLVNLIFYIIRAVIVGYTSIMENLLSWIINVVSNTNVEDKSLNMSSTEASTSDSDNKITVDKILFNKLELFDINEFSKD